MQLLPLLRSIDKNGEKCCRGDEGNIQKMIRMIRQYLFRARHSSRVEKVLLLVCCIGLYLLFENLSTIIYAKNLFILHALDGIRFPLPVGEVPPKDKFRFPTYEERLKYYMSDWYANNKTGNTNHTLCRDYFYDYGSPDFPHLWDRALLQRQIKRRTKWGPNWFDMTYEEDALNYFSSSNQRLLFSFGDWLTLEAKHLALNPKYPIIAKSRHRNSSLILGLLNERRHYDEVKDVRQFSKWSEKKDAVVFRGDSTGRRVETFVNFFSSSASSSFDPTLSNFGFGSSFTFSSHLKLFDFGFAKLVQGHDTAENRKLFLKDRLSLKQLTKYKFLLVIPGNDVSTGLKWMLYSNSVVMMPIPRKVSWAMEEYLVPYVHYIPIQDDLSDLQTQLQWAMQHDEECQQISRYATQFIIDLYVSEEAQRTTRRLQKEIGKRYHELYGDWFTDC